MLDGSRSDVFEKDKQPAPDGEGRRSSSAAAARRRRPPRGDERPDLASAARRPRRSRRWRSSSRDDADRHAADPGPAAHPARRTGRRSEARPLLDALLAYVRKMPAAERTVAGGARRAAIRRRAGGAAAGRPRRKPVREELGELGVRVIRLGTRARADGSTTRTCIVVRAGKPVEFVFENTDLMPHNFVIAQPGALEEIGTAGRGDGHAARRAGAAVRARSRTRCCWPARCCSRASRRSSASPRRRSRASIRMSAPIPATGGGCTGRCTSSTTSTSTWPTPRRTWPSNPLPIKDELLEDRRPRTEWKLEDLAAGRRASSTHGRSFANGKQMFQVASCVACHKLDGVGNEFGPDLTKLDPKLTAADILKEMLEPSAKINEKFQTYVFETRVGQGRHRPGPRGDAASRSR